MSSPVAEAVSSVETAAEDSDAALAERWQAGDLASGEMLIRRHLPRLHAFLATRAGSSHEAEDLAQEVFIAAARRIDLYSTAQPFAAWLYGIARHKVADAWRGHRPTEPFEPKHESTEERSPATLCEAAESAADAWRQVFQRLPEIQATALWLRVQEDFSLEAIASQLEISGANARVLLFRARQTLSRIWPQIQPS